jgi:plasmid stability protein
VPTIQVREVPEETYRVIRLRAKAEGKSLQAFMRDLLIELASRRTKAEAAAAIEEALARYGGAGSTPEQIVAAVRAGRR